ncbi:MAG: hypothetical protein EOO65_04320, partial [Methanosarcinales archaeon]
MTVPVEWTVKWPSIPKCDVLMVRQFYDRFIEQHVWCVLPKKEGAVARPENQLVITGTPGIGKSAFGMYLLHRALNAGKTAVFVRNAQSQGIPFITVFHGGAVWKASSVGGALGGLIDDPEVVLLYDGVRPDTIGYNTILITAPDPTLWKRFCYSGAPLFFFPIFSLHELLQLQQLDPKHEPLDVQARYNLVGGSARYVMGAFPYKNLCQKMQSAANYVSPSALQRLSYNPRELPKEDMIHNLIHYEVDRATFDITGLKFASAQVMKMCEERAKRGEEADVAAFQVAAEQMSLFDGVTGQVFEFLCPRRIAGGVLCQLRPLGVSGIRTKSYHTTGDVHINHFDHLAGIKIFSDDVMWVASALNHHTLHMFLPDGRCMNCAMGAHELLIEGFQGEDGNVRTGLRAVVETLPQLLKWSADGASASVDFVWATYKEDGFKAMKSRPFAPPGTNVGTDDAPCFIATVPKPSGEVGDVRVYVNQFALLVPMTPTNRAKLDAAATGAAGDMDTTDDGAPAAAGAG